MKVFTIAVLVTILSAQNSRAVEKSILVSGECLRSILPDRGAVAAAADFLKAETKSAHREATRSYEQFRDAVKRLNLKDLELRTTETRIEEVKEYEKNKYVHKGYRARMGLEVSTSEVSRIGEVIQVAENSGMKDIGSLRTFVSLEKMKAERESCLEEAIRNARSKAERMAKAANTKVGSVLEIRERPLTQDEEPRPRLQLAASKSMEMGDAAAQVEVAQTKVNVQVTVIFALN